MTAQPVTLGNGKGVLDIAFDIVADACKIVTLTGAKIAGSVGTAALDGCDGLLNAAANATTPPSLPHADSPTKNFAAMLQGCGTLNLGISESRKGVSLQEERDVNPGVTGQLSVAALFGENPKHCAAMRA
jgi:hypothetical protein